MLLDIDLIYVLNEGSPSKCLFPGGQLIKNASNAPHVRFLVIGLSNKNLRCHVDRGATKSARHIKSPAERLGHSEIADFELKPRCQEDVLWFQISVEDFLFVHGVNTCDQG